jgi:hypothetical protein
MTRPLVNSGKRGSDLRGLFDGSSALREKLIAYVSIFDIYFPSVYRRVRVLPVSCRSVMGGDESEIRRWNETARLVQPEGTRTLEG